MEGIKGGERDEEEKGMRIDKKETSLTGRNITMAQSNIDSRKCKVRSRVYTRTLIAVSTHSGDRTYIVSVDRCDSTYSVSTDSGNSKVETALHNAYTGGTRYVHGTDNGLA